MTKKYFRPDVELHSTVQRDVLYTNRWLLGRDPVSLPVGELTASTITGGPVYSIQAAITEHLEATHPDGTSAVQVATSGNELLDDFADVLSFALNSVFSRDRDMVERLVPRDLKNLGRDVPAQMFRETFDPGRILLESELNELGSFMDELLALERPEFERAMRAIRRIVRAAQRGAEDPTLAYTDLVVALESLVSSNRAIVPPKWDDYPDEKREPIDAALADVDAQAAEKVRGAILKGEELRLSRRFVEFTLEHVTPEFFRTEARDASRPIPALDLPGALRSAYAVRSRNVHSLLELPPEVWALNDRADTVHPPGLGVLLTLEGLARFARHVVRNFIARAPAGNETSFDWRASLPGQVSMRVAPQYWIHSSDGFDHTSAERYFGGFLEHMLSVRAGSEDAATDMRSVLEAIEDQAPSLSNNPAQAQMVAIYVLWHIFLVAEAHRPDAEKFIDKHEQVLAGPSIPAFAVGVLTEIWPDWTTDQWLQLANERHDARKRRKAAPLPTRIDVLLQMQAAHVLYGDNRDAEAKEYVSRAVEEMPGTEELIAWEQELAADSSPAFDVVAFLGFPEKDKSDKDAT